MPAKLPIRLFLSSPGDVGEERRIARRVIKTLEGSHLLRDRVRFEIIAWDDPYASAPMDATETPQASVNRYSGRPSTCDLTVVVLWSRIGTCLPEGLTRADGSTYASGTVWEYEDAASAEKPVFVYRRTEVPRVDLDDPAFEQKRAQYAGVSAFFRQFENRDGSLRAGVNRYARPEDFERALRQHLEAFVNDRLDAASAGASPVDRDDPAVTRILRLLGQKEVRIDEMNVELERLRAENESLKRDAIARTLTAAAQPDASPAAREAGAALEAGDTRPAEVLLRDEERSEADTISTSLGENAEQRRKAAELAREQGALAFGHDTRAALDAYRRAAEYEPDDIWTHFFIGDLELQLGDSFAAMGSYGRAATRAHALAARDPANAGWQRDLSVSHIRIGDVLVAQGDGPGALAAFRKGLAIGESLVARDPSNTQWQRDLSVSHNKIGYVLVAQGDGPGALAAFRTGLAIREALAARDPANTEWQRDLSISHDRLGDVLFAQGDAPGALATFREGLAIRKALAARNPANTEWQRDLSISHNKIGDVLVAQGDGPGALAAFRKDLAIAEALAARDPANTEWQRDLSISHDRIGDVLLAQGDGSGALAAFRKGLTIRESLAARDPANTQWQRDLSVSQDRIGEVLVAQGDGPGALAAFRTGLTIRESLAMRDPANTRWRRDLSVSYNRIGSLLVTQGDGPGALTAFRKDLAIAEALAARDPTNTQWQRDLAISCCIIATVDDGTGSTQDRRTHLQRSLNILLQQRDLDQLPVANAHWIADIEKALKELP